MTYGYRKETEGDFAEVVERTKEELKKEGFGILTEVNVRETLKKKLDVEHDDYVILGACNPPFAYKALKAEKEIGLMLPCNLIVYRENNKIFVSTILPTVAMSMIDNSELKKIAEEAEEKLKRVIDSI